MAKIEKRSDLKRLVAQLVDACHVQGIQLPWLITAVAINGSVLALRMTAAREGKGVEAETLAEKHIDSAMVLPINFMIVDATGHAFHFSTDQDGLSPSLNLRPGPSNAEEIKTLH